MKTPSGSPSPSDALDHNTVSPRWRAPRPLLRHKELDHLRDAMTIAGHREESETLIDEAKRHATYLERCALEAESVLHGDLGAASRVWLLLNHSVDVRPKIPTSIVHEIMGTASHGAPKAVDGGALLRLVAGVVRAANTPTEAGAMLDALDALLYPLFVLELAAVSYGARERGRHARAEDTRYLAVRARVAWIARAHAGSNGDARSSRCRLAAV